MQTARRVPERLFSSRSTMPRPLGSPARVLLTSVFGPYAMDDEHGSRLINPMELYHNQVTRVEGAFSLRMFHRSWGLMLVQANIAAPCTLLDFPTLDRFVEEIFRHRYDVVGISSIATNVLKVERMCELVRQHLPAAAIVVGGHVANIADLAERIDADWIVRGKGKWIDFYRTGDELFDVMCRIEQSVGNRSFFIMDENFLFHRRRALRLLELMRENDKSWMLYVFSSADVIESCTMEQLIALGVSWIWMGVEGENTEYAKLARSDTFELVQRLQSHGIRVLGSTIIGLEEHTPENIDQVIEHAVRHRTDFHQFMLYMPLPGTPLHGEISAQGRMLEESECPLADTHGQSRFNYRHPPHSCRVGVRADRAGIRSRFRGQRSEYAASGADHFDRLAAIQEPRRSADSAAICLGNQRNGHHVFGGRRSGR